MCPFFDISSRIISYHFVSSRILSYILISSRMIKGRGIKQSSIQKIIPTTQQFPGINFVERNLRNCRHLRIELHGRRFENNTISINRNIHENYQVIVERIFLHFTKLVLPLGRSVDTSLEREKGEYISSDSPTV